MSFNRMRCFYLWLLTLLAIAGCRSDLHLQRTSLRVSPNADRFASDLDASNKIEPHYHASRSSTPFDDVQLASGLVIVDSPVASAIVREASSPVFEDISKGILADDCKLTLDEVVALALANNPTIPQARSLVQQQQGTTVQAGLYPNPQVGYLRSDPDKSDKSRSSGAFLSQEFVTAGKLKLAQLASQYDVTLRCLQVTAQEQRVVNDVRVRFYELASAQEAVKIADEMILSADDGLRIIQTMKDAFIGTKPDVLQAEMQQSSARRMRHDAQLRIDAAWQSLEAVVGTTLQRCLISLDSDIQMPELTWESSLQRLLTESPLLKAQEAELKAAQTEIQLSDAQAIPNVNTQMVAQRDSTEKFSSIGTFVSISAPIFNRNQGNRTAARAFYAQQVREYERLKLALSDQLSVAMRQYKSFQYESQRLESEVLPRAEENLELTTSAYKSGRMDFQRVVDARKLLYQTKLARIESIAEMKKSLVEIDGLQLTGALNPTEVGTALQSTASSSTNGARSILSQQLQNAAGNANRNIPAALQAGDF